MHFLILFVLIISCLPSCSLADAQKKPFISVSDAVSEINLVGTKKLMEQWEFDSLFSQGISTIAFNPYAFTNLKESQVIFNQDWQWKGEQTTGVQQHIKMAHKAGIKTGIIPHLWIDWGTFTGTANWENPEQFFSDYSKFLVACAKLAEQEHIEFLALGKELGKVFHNHPTLVNNLIDSARTYYSGTLTYAANWDEYKRTSIWEKLDLISVNAYFPIHTSESIQTHQRELLEVRKKFKKEVWFTEWGFRSSTNNTELPWEYKSDCKPCISCQKEAISVFQQEFIQQLEIEKSFYWKFFPPHIGKTDSCDYTIK